MSPESRAEYFRERRKAMKQFVVMIDREKFERLDRKLKADGTTKAEWFRKKVDEEIGE